MKKMKQIPSGFEPYVNKVEVARRLNKTVRTVDNWMLHGRIPYYKIGRSVVFKFSEVEKMLFETSGIVNPKTTINPSKETDGHIHELEESERIIKQLIAENPNGVTCPLCNGSRKFQNTELECPACKPSNP